MFDKPWIIKVYNPFNCILFLETFIIRYNVYYEKVKENCVYIFPLGESMSFNISYM